MEQQPVGLKLLLSYNVRDETVNEYRQFVLQQYIPGLQEMGFQVSEVWHTAYGDAPNRVIGFVCRERGTVDKLLASRKWETLNETLVSYVLDFSYKVIPYRGIFQL